MPRAHVRLSKSVRKKCEYAKTNVKRFVSELQTKNKILFWVGKKTGEMPAISHVGPPGRENRKDAKIQERFEKRKQLKVYGKEIRFN